MEQTSPGRSTGLEHGRACRTPSEGGDPSERSRTVGNGKLVRFYSRRQRPARELELHPRQCNAAWIQLDVDCIEVNVRQVCPTSHPHRRPLSRDC